LLVPQGGSHSFTHSKVKKLIEQTFWRFEMGGLFPP
jgi:hypothetical protein